VLPAGQPDTVRVPFDVLPTEDGACLIYRYTISYILTGRDLLRPGAPAADTASPPVVIGDPDFGEAKPDVGTRRRKGEFWGRLWTTVRRAVTLGLLKPVPETSGPPGAGPQGSGPFQLLSASRREAEQIAEVLGVRRWLGGKADKARIAAGGSPRFLHLATHAFTLGEPTSDCGRPADATAEASRSAGSENALRRTGLALAGANRDAVDGRLTAWDVTGSDLGLTEAVVLPAGMPTDEAVSGAAAVRLPPSLVLAGARAVVTSLWPVADGPRRELLADFYRRVLAGQPSAEALGVAQRCLRAEPPIPRSGEP
jgi:CHAT domain-containing protein